MINWFESALEQEARGRAQKIVKELRDELFLMRSAAKSRAMKAVYKKVNEILRRKMGGV